jgi:putative endonuclease
MVPGSTRTARQRLGSWGEDKAAAHLSAAGYVIIARNWRCKAGEIDLVATAPDGALCFIEVRTSRSLQFGGAAASFAPRKRNRLLAIAQAYLGENPAQAARIDVFLWQRRDGAWHAEHLQNVVEATST